MIRKVTDYAPAPLTDFTIYPGELPDFSYLFHGDTIELVLPENVWNILQSRLSQKGLPSLRDRYPVLCSGSNANPAQIQQKFADADFEVTVPMIKGNLSGAGPAFAGHVSVYGAIPATMDQVDHSDQQGFTALYTEAQLDRIIETENDNYWLAWSDDVRFEIPGVRTVLHPYAFISKGGVLTFGNGNPVRLQLYSQREILRRILARINGATRSLDYHAYFADPLRHRAQLQQAMTDAGLTRPPVIPWERASRADPVPFRRLI